MNHKRCLNNINNSLNVINFDKGLKDMSQSHDTPLNLEFFIELILLSKGFDILGLNNAHHSSPWNGVYVILNRLGLIHTVKKHIDGKDTPFPFNYVICVLSPLGKDLVKNESTLKDASESFFKHYIQSRENMDLGEFDYHGGIPKLDDAIAKSRCSTESVNQDYENLCGLIMSAPFDSTDFQYRSMSTKHGMIPFLLKHQHVYVKALHGKHPLDSLTIMMNHWMFNPNDIDV